MDDYAVGGDSEAELEEEPEADETDGEEYDDSASESDEDASLKTTEDVAAYSRSSRANVRAMHVLAPADRRTPAVLSLSETAQTVALMADYIARNGTALPPSETDKFSLTNFCRYAAIREIQLGTCPFKIRRVLGELPNGEKIVDEFRLEELAKPHLKF